MIQAFFFRVTPQASAVDQATTKMGNLSLEQVKDSDGNPSKKKAKVICPCMDKFGLDVVELISSFLQPDKLLLFLGTSRGAMKAGEKMLTNNPGSMSAILKSVKGTISEIREPLRSIVIKVAPSMKTLDLAGVKVTALDVKKIVQTFTALENLNFGGWDVYKETSHFVHISSLTNLRTLDLGHRWITSEDTPHFKKLTSLEVLSLNGKISLKDADLRNIVSCSKLRRLSFKSDAVTQGYQPLCTLEHLTFLDLSSSAINDTGLLCIVKIRQLGTLLLSECTKITAKGFVKFFQHLTRQDLELSELSEEGKPHEHLQELDVSYTKIDHNSFKYMQSVKKLTWVNVSECDNIKASECVELSPRFHKFQDLIKKQNIDGLLKYKVHLITVARSLYSSIFATEDAFDQFLRSLPLPAVNQERHFVCKLIQEFAWVADIKKIFFHALPSKIAGMIRDFRLLVGPEQTELNQLFFHDRSCQLRNQTFTFYHPSEISELLNTLALCYKQDERLLDKSLFDHFTEQLKKRDLTKFSAEDITNIFSAVELGLGDAYLLSQFATEIVRRKQDFHNLTYFKEVYESRDLKFLS